MAGLMWNVRCTLERSKDTAQEVRDAILAKYGEGNVTAVPAILEVAGQRYELKVKLTQGEKGSLTGITAARTPAVPFVGVPKEKPTKASNAKVSNEELAEQLLAL